MIVAVIVDATADVAIGNVPLEPCAMVTLAGTDAAALFEESVATAPPAGAGAVSAMVPADGFPPVTLKRVK